METVVGAMDHWRGRKVLLTGHTGFKGSWLALWLHRLGAEVTGVALPPPSDPSLFDQARVADLLDHRIADIRDCGLMEAIVDEVRPEVIFHLAAQPLVRSSYDQPVETFATNVMGTIHLMEAARKVGGVGAFVCITTDKCYENREWDRAYVESDPMGGHDPYSASKGCAELAASAYRRSFFPVAEIASGGMALATVRAGNVIGGGDWAEDRLIPDIVRAFEAGQAPAVRAPDSIRPWQHVLEALHGYVMIAGKLLDRDAAFADAWNFGPADDDARPVAWIVAQMQALWGQNAPPAPWQGEYRHEAGLLKLDTTKAREELGWSPSLPLAEALGWIVEWHRGVLDGADPRALTLEQIARYEVLSGAEFTQG